MRGVAIGLGAAAVLKIDPFAIPGVSQVVRATPRRHGFNYWLRRSVLRRALSVRGSAGTVHHRRDRHLVSGLDGYCIHQHSPRTYSEAPGMDVARGRFGARSLHGSLKYDTDRSCIDANGRKAGGRLSEFVLDWLGHRHSDCGVVDSTDQAWAHDKCVT